MVSGPTNPVGGQGAAGVERLRARIARVEDGLKILEQEDHDLFDGTDILVRGLAWASPSRWRFGHSFSLEIASTRRRIDEAKKEIDKGNIGHAFQEIREADAGLASAAFYLSRSAQSGRRALQPMAAGLTFTATAGLTAAVGAATRSPTAASSVASAGLHVAGQFLLPEDDSHIDRTLAEMTAARGADKFVPRTVGALVDEAQNRLYRWDQGERDVPPDVDKFLLDVDTIDEDISIGKYNRRISYWNGKVDRAIAALGQGPQDWEQRVMRLVVSLWGEFDLSHYVRKNARLGDLCDGFNVNCDGRLRVLLAALARAGIRPPIPWRWAVQVFREHVILVAYNKDTGEVWDIVSGNRTRDLESDLYEPQIVYWAFLKKMGLVPAVDAKKLLIAKAKERRDQKIPPPFETDTNFEYPYANNVYSEDPIPERTLLPAPYSTSVQGSRDASGRMVAGGVSRGGGHSIRIIVDAADIGERAFSLEVDQIRFARSEDAERFGKPEKEKDARLKQREVLTELAIEDLIAHLSKPGMEFARQLIDNPASAENIPLEEFASLSFEPFAMNEYLQDIIRVETYPYVLYSEEELPRERDLYNYIRSEARRRSEEYRGFDAKAQLLRDDVVRDPMKYVRLIERLSARSSVYFERFTRLFGFVGKEVYPVIGGCDGEVCTGSYLAARSAAMGAIADRLGNPNLVGITKVARSAPAVSPPAPRQFQVVGIMDDVSGPATKAARQGDANRTGWRRMDDGSIDDSKSVERVSPEFMVQAILEWSSYYESLLKRWDPNLSAAFVKEFDRSPDPVMAGRFNDIYVKIVPSYPPSVEMVPNPMPRRGDWERDYPPMVPKDIAEILGRTKSFL